MAYICKKAEIALTKKKSHSIIKVRYKDDDEDSSLRGNVSESPGECEPDTEYPMIANITSELRLERITDLSTNRRLPNRYDGSCIGIIVQQNRLVIRNYSFRPVWGRKLFFLRKGEHNVSKSINRLKFR